MSRRLNFVFRGCLGLPVLGIALTLRADWPTLHGNVRREGFLEAELKPPFRLAWARSFAGERLGTAMEPMVAGGRVFVATHSGKVYALDAGTGHCRWGFGAHGAFLQSPACADGFVVAAGTDGNVYALDATTGRAMWTAFCGPGGFAASPAISGGTVYIGTRSGDFLALGLRTGRVIWKRTLGIPIRQSAAVAEDRVFITGEDLRVRCFDGRDGTLLWTSLPLAGQTARDYYPILIRSGGRAYLVVRTNPVLNMAQRIARDRQVLARNAGVDDSDWKKLDAWTKSDAARGNPDLWTKEQKTVAEYLDGHREARSFYVLDPDTGRERVTAPVMWIGGCQGVGAMPALTPDGRLLVFYRSAYGNWNHGVAPLVALGLLDLAANQITPLFHQYGMQPAWNTFWGTADESQNFVVAGHTVLIVHQGTLSGFDLKASRLFPIWGERDTFGGFADPGCWNEWHGPGRGGVAVDGGRIYWITGSRLLCLEPGTGGGQVQDTEIDERVAPASAPPRQAPDLAEIRRRLAVTTAECLSQRWAPLVVEPGLAGREFFFDHSGETFEALAWACPHLTDGLKQQLKAFLAEEWTAHPPFTRAAWYSLGEGSRREWHPVPKEMLSRPANDKPRHPFGNLYSAWLYASRCGETNRVLAAWHDLKASFDDFKRGGWRLDGTRGDLHANSYLASLDALSRMARCKGDPDTAAEADALAAETLAALKSWWARATNLALLHRPRGSKELDPFINRGDALSFAVAPHRHKIALLHEITPEVLDRVDARLGRNPWIAFQLFLLKYPTWHLVGEERQVHDGENFADTPDLALDAFKATAWMRPRADPALLASRVDLPCCRADLYYLTKLALALEADQARREDPP